MKQLTKLVMVISLFLGTISYANANDGTDWINKSFTRDEFIKHAQERAGKMFDRIDKDHKGVVTAEQMKTFWQNKMEKKWGKFPVSKADYLKKQEAKFNAIDVNHDGIITSAEVKDYWKAQRAKWHKENSPMKNN
jgi:hypothetical protein